MIDGIYTAYFTGAAGNGLAMFVFRKGSIAGADTAGLTFSGEYQVSNGWIEGNVDFTMPTGTASITGAVASEQDLSVSVPIRLPEILNPEETYRIETPIGPINARFKKTKELA